MTLSSKLGMKAERPVISLQRSGDGWILSFSSGVADVKIYTESDVETGSFEDSAISETNYGYKATVRTEAPPEKLGWHDDIYILGHFRRTVIENDRECDFYFKDRKVHTGKKFVYVGPLLPELPNLTTPIQTIGQRLRKMKSRTSGNRWTITGSSK